MSTAQQALGLAGERIAARWLIQRGWVLLAHRYRTGHRDIDLVMQQGALVAFIEVKARRSQRFGAPAQAVGWRKQRELTTGATIWMHRHGRPGTSYRFDVVEVVVFGTNARINHIAGAFVVENRPP